MRSVSAFIAAAVLALAPCARAQSPDWRTPPLGAASLATNYVMTWGGYTLGAERNGVNDHIFPEVHDPLNGFTLCSWVAAADADGIRSTNALGGILRGTDVLPSLYYSPNVERSAPDILSGAWGWGGEAVAVAGGLSFDYAFPAGGVQYHTTVRFTGDQYIDTLCPVTPDTIIAACWYQDGNNKQQRLFGVNDGNGKAYALYINNNYRWAANMGSSSGEAILLATARTWYEGLFDLASGQTTVNGTAIHQSGTPFSSTNTIPIGARRNVGTAIYADYPATFRIGWFKIWQGGAIVRDFAPASVGGEAGLFDLVHGRFYPSETSTPLVAGPARDPTNALERCYSLGWNGGATGTNAFPRGSYTVSWTDLTADLTLTAGGTDITLAAPAGTRNVSPGEAAGFILTGTATGHVGISRMKIHPFYGTGRISSASTEEVSSHLLSSNFCFVAHRVGLDSISHTNALLIRQPDGSTWHTGESCELPPDGTTALQTNGFYQLVYTTVGSLDATYIYEWDRRQFPRWLSDEDLDSIYEDGARVRAAFGYDPCVVTNAPFQPEP